MFPSHQCQKWGIALQSWYPLTTVSLVAAGVLTNLSTVALSNNQLTGPLPESWGENGNLPGLQSLDVSANNLSGPLPSVWGHNNSFMLLTNLNLANNTLSGGLPAAWANLGRFPALQQLEVQYNQLSGADGRAVTCRQCQQYCMPSVSCAADAGLRRGQHRIAMLHCPLQSHGRGTVLSQAIFRRVGVKRTTCPSSTR